MENARFTPLGALGGWGVSANPGTVDLYTPLLGCTQLVRIAVFGAAFPVDIVVSAIFVCPRKVPGFSECTLRNRGGGGGGLLGLMLVGKDAEVLFRGRRWWTCGVWCGEWEMGC